MQRCRAVCTITPPGPSDVKCDVFGSPEGNDTTYYITLAAPQVSTVSPGERPPTMCPAKATPNAGLRLAMVTLLAATVAGCSLNPFARDDEPAPRPAADRSDNRSDDRSGSASGGSRSLYSNAPGQASSQTAYSQPEQRVELIENRVALAPGAPEQYVVQEGDTLWDIASTFLRDPWYWPEVWFLNPQVENPHLIYPGDVLAMLTIDGQQRITTVSGSAYRLSPQARVTPLEEAVQTIPYEDIASFLTKGLVLERDEAEDLPYILATRDNHIIAAAGNQVYVRGTSADARGTRYSVVHVDEELVDPDDGRTVGYQAVYVGEGVMSRGGDPATVALTDTNREALLGDRLIPEAVDIPLNFFPKAPDTSIDGRIISVVDGVSLIGQYQVVVINRGSRDGLAPGDVLDVFQTGETVRDRFRNAQFMGASSRGEKVKLPDEQAGTVMVFKVYDRIGYGLVMEATSAIKVLDSVKNPS